jgi:hypothetical protein
MLYYPREYWENCLLITKKGTFDHQNVLGNDHQKKIHLITKLISTK